MLFVLGPAKTGKAALGALSPWSLAMLTAHVKKLGVELASNAPIFRNRSGAPYFKETISDDFRTVRGDIDPADRRQLADMRRSVAMSMATPAGMSGSVGAGHAAHRRFSTPRRAAARAV